MLPALSSRSAAHPCSWLGFQVTFLWLCLGMHPVLMPVLNAISIPTQPFHHPLPIPTQFQLNPIPNPPSSPSHLDPIPNSTQSLSYPVLSPSPPHLNPPPTPIPITSPSRSPLGRLSPAPSAAGAALLPSSDERGAGSAPATLSGALQTRSAPRPTSLPRSGHCLRGPPAEPPLPPCPVPINAVGSIRRLSFLSRRLPGTRGGFRGLGQGGELLPSEGLPEKQPAPALWGGPGRAAR